MAAHDHVLRELPPRGFPTYPGYPALPAATLLCYAIADGCTICQERHLDENAADAIMGATMIAFTAEVITVAHDGTFPAHLGTEATRRGAHVPGRPFVEAARAAYAACPATCAANGIPAALAVEQKLSPDARIAALTDAVLLLGVYLPRTYHYKENAIHALAANTC
jgi:hypothetical protein